MQDGGVEEAGRGGRGGWHREEGERRRAETEQEGGEGDKDGRAC